MSLILLTAAAMISVTDDLLNREEKQKIFHKDPLLQSLLDPLRVAHRNLIVLTRQEGEAEREEKIATARLQECNQEHDILCRGMDAALTFATNMCRSADEAQPFEDARSLILPQGLGIISAAYRDQAGHALGLGERVSPDVRATLSRVHFDGEDLNAPLNRYIELGRIMSELIARRAELQSEEDDTRVSAQDLRQARYQWQRVISALISLLEISSISAGDKRRLLTNLRAAQAQAQARRTRYANGNATEDDVAEEHDIIEDDVLLPQLDPAAPTAEIRRHDSPQPLPVLEPGSDIN